MIRILALGALMAAAVAQAEVELVATPVADVSSVTDIRNAGDGSNRLFLARQSGEVEVLAGGALAPEPFIDVGDRISLGSERGLLSIAFSPRFETDRTFFLYYTDEFGSSTLERFQTLAEDGERADPASGRVILSVPQPLSNHNGGRAVFGADGMLYLSIGDGGGAGDPEGNGQNPFTLLGTVLRLDVLDQETYAIPADNPFVGDDGVRDEIWALGLRNPWRISVDRQTGDLYIADVGQDRFEEINFEAAGSGGGRNYGWNLYEGDVCFRGGCTGSEPVTFPVQSYSHDVGCSVTGGEVYRGPDYPALAGTYLYADFCTGRIWGLRQADGAFVAEVLVESGVGPTTFGEDERGNVYLAGGGRVFLLSDGEPVADSGVPVDGSFSGTWVVDGLPDQGFFVTIGERPDGSRFAFIAWFTFDAGAPLWLVGVAELAPGASSFDLPLEQVEGPEFLDFSTVPAQRTPFGTMRLRATDCDTIVADYEFPGRGSGTLDLTRLTGIEGRDCRAGR